MSQLRKSYSIDRHADPIIRSFDTISSKLGFFNHAVYGSDSPTPLSLHFQTQILIPAQCVNHLRNEYNSIK